MKKDIQPPKVEDIAVAVVPELNDLAELEWNVYVINFKSKNIEGVLVSSHGYGTIDEEQVKTTELRHFLDEMKANSFKKVEMIMENTFGLTNQYWVSFWENNSMLDKKFLFVPDSIQDANLVMIPLIGKKGVVIR
ncbi:MAG: hypothetical protein AAF193_06740 [Bacteroidota bacterium]